MKDRNIAVLNQIIKYINEINGTVSRFDLDFDKFTSDYVMRNAISMCLLQIGELAGKLSDEFKLENNKMPWRDIISIRNKAAHAYGSMDMEIIWNIAKNDIPALQDYCNEIIENYTVSEQNNNPKE